MRQFALALVCMVNLGLVTTHGMAGESYARWAGAELLLRGHDTTAYLTKGKAIQGDTNQVVNWNGGTWRFASAQEAALFKANPKAYAPQFGAYCTGGLSQRHVVDGNPGIWRLYKNKLYLFFAMAGAKRFDSDPEGVILAARAYAKTVGIVEH